MTMMIPTPTSKLSLTSLTADCCLTRYWWNREDRQDVAVKLEAVIADGVYMFVSWWRTPRPELLVCAAACRFLLCTQLLSAGHCGKCIHVELAVFQMGTSVTPTCAFTEPVWISTKVTPASVTVDTRENTATNVSLEEQKRVILWTAFKPHLPPTREPVYLKTKQTFSAGTFHLSKKTDEVHEYCPDGGADAHRVNFQKRFLVFSVWMTRKPENEQKYFSVYLR